MTDEIEEVIEALHAAGDATDMGNYPKPAWFDRQAEKLKEATERNVSDDLAMDPEHFAALVAEEVVQKEKRTNARVITEPRSDSR